MKSLYKLYEECKKEFEECVAMGAGGMGLGVEVPANASICLAPTYKVKKLNNNKLANKNFAKRLGKGKKTFSQGWGAKEDKD